MTSQPITAFLLKTPVVSWLSDSVLANPSNQSTVRQLPCWAIYDERSAKSQTTQDTLEACLQELTSIPCSVWILSTILGARPSPTGPVFISTSPISHRSSCSPWTSGTPICRSLGCHNRFTRQPLQPWSRLPRPRWLQWGILCVHLWTSNECLYYRFRRSS